MQKLIKYGGAVTGLGEFLAITRSVLKSTFTRQWQAGEQAKKLEKELAEYLGVKHAILTTSGSCAGLLALSALELPKGSEVIIPAVTFPTIFNIIPQTGLTPVVIDVEVGSYNLDPDKLEALITPNTKAIIAVHAVGNPANMARIRAIAHKHNIKIIEDNCDGFGTDINGTKAGALSDVSFTSLHAAHIVSMGVGGVVFTNDDTIARNARMYKDWGRQAEIEDKWNGDKWPDIPPDQDSRFIYEKVGYNFQILELQAAMGRVQLKKVQKIKSKRKKHFDYLFTRLSKFPELILPVYSLENDICWFAFPLSTVGDREPLLKYLEMKGIETRSMFAGNILKHPAYRDMNVRSSTLESADWVLKHSFWISCHPSLTEHDLKRIISAFEEYYAQTPGNHYCCPHE